MLRSVVSAGLPTRCWFNAIPMCPSHWGRDSPMLPVLLNQIPGEGGRMAPVTRTDATRHSSTDGPSQPSRSGVAAGRGKKTARLRSQESKPCTPPRTTIERSGSAERDTIPEAGSKLRCASSKPMASASAHETLDRQTAEIQIRIALMNRFSTLETAEIVRVA